MGEVIRLGDERARTGPWRGDRDVALLTPLPDAPLPSAEFLGRCLGVLAERGYQRVVTGALSPLEQSSFLEAGFAVVEDLHLLSHDLRAMPPRPRANIRRATDADRAAVLVVDHDSFTPFWRLDGDGLTDTLAATPRVRFRVATNAGDAVVGYAITGRAGRRGYVQRLAVSASSRLQGHGSGLVSDGLWWLRRWRVTRVLVNTQYGNDTALELYKRLGFEPEPVGLAVLEAACAG